nr:Inner membrane protein YebE [Candidatus Pantoea persica]
MTTLGTALCPAATRVMLLGSGELALQRAQAIAGEVVKALGGYGLFGVGLFVYGDEVIFSEVSPRPHDTGMVTLIS